MEDEWIGAEGERETRKEGRNQQQTYFIPWALDVTLHNQDYLLIVSTYSS